MSKEFKGDCWGFGRDDEVEIPIVTGIVTERIKPPLEIIVDTIVVDHTTRILNLEKQVADLRAALEEHLNPRTRKPRKGVDPRIYGSMLYD